MDCSAILYIPFFKLGKGSHTNISAVSNFVSLLALDKINDITPDSNFCHGPN